MDWDRAIATNQAALARIVAALIALLELRPGGVLTRLPRPLYRAVLRVLRPAESAARRLIVIIARSVEVELPPVRPMPTGLVLKAGSRTGTAFPLYDARRRFGVLAFRAAGPRPEPRIHIFAVSPLVPFQPPVTPCAETPRDDGMVGAERLGRRLTALKRALETLPTQAKRLARWQARRGGMARPKFISPLRLGLPPGHRKDPRDEVDRVLNECHALARRALTNDSS